MPNYKEHLVKKFFSVTGNDEGVILNKNNENANGEINCTYATAFLSGDIVKTDANYVTMHLTYQVLDNVGNDVSMNWECKVPIEIGGKTDINWELVSNYKYKYEVKLPKRGSRRGWINVEMQDVMSDGISESPFDMESLQIKLDGEGNEWVNKDNIGVRGNINFYINVQEICDLSSYEKLIESIKIQPLVDGYDYYTSIDDPYDMYTPSVNLRIRRNNPHERNRFSCDFNNKINIYPGQIILADERLMNCTPRYISFSNGERKPLEISCDNTPTDNPFNKAIEPTEVKMHEAISRLKRALAKDNDYPASEFEAEYYDFEPGMSADIGGVFTISIAGGLAGNVETRRRVIIVREKVFTISLNNNIIKGSDIFDFNELDLQRLKRAIGDTAPAIIQDVTYGRMAVFVASSKSAFKTEFKISDFKGSINAGKETKITTILYGGTVEGLDLNGEGEGMDLAEKVFKYLQDPTNKVKMSQVTSLVPIEYSASYLANIDRPVIVSIKRYDVAKVDQIRMKIVDENTGVSASCKFRCLNVIPDKYGKMVYDKLYEDKKVGYDTMISPRAVCLEFKMDAYGSSSEDHNIFCPRVPWEKLFCDEDNGIWTFRLLLKGYTLWNQSFMFSPTLPGCYISESSKHYLNNNGILDKTELWENVPATKENENNMLLAYFSWCEYYYWNNKSVKRLTEADTQNPALRVTSSGIKYLFKNWSPETYISSSK